jgi:2-polyprenyl-3-methyl-5-hydroxy-6-metoxy-1,4-benzoquinol methylase
MSSVVALRTSLAPICDCCHSDAWDYLFSENDYDLGRCQNCGLHYIKQMPDQAKRMTEMENGHPGEQVQSNAVLHLRGEQQRETAFQRYVDLGSANAPLGRWLDIGCGTGTLISLATRKGIFVEGIELTADRREAARKQTGATIYSEPLEALRLGPSSFAAVTMINVFSHLVSPMTTFREINRILKPNGIFLLATGEIGVGVRKHHMFTWDLGDHLYWLGEDTIERYATQTGFTLIHRDKLWQPAEVFRRERFKTSGRSKIRNAIKLACLTPGVFPVVRWYALRRHRESPVYASTLILQKH